jgi:endonuclease/exonuclease/phosphatase family metal-dependent hydrolase
VNGKGGGLVLFWSEEVNVSLISFSLHHIDVRITEKNGNMWRCTCVYGEPKAQDRVEMWKLLRRIKLDVKEPWVMIGDFNEAMWQHEHLSESKRNESLMENFRNVLSHCNLHDLGFTGLPWTYNNKQKGKKNVRVRLDRAVASPE